MTLTDIIKKTISTLSPQTAKTLSERALAKAKASAEQTTALRYEFGRCIQFCEVLTNDFDRWVMEKTRNAYVVDLQKKVEKTNKLYTGASTYQARQDVAEQRLVFYAGTANLLKGCPLEKVFTYRELVKDLKKIAPTSEVLQSVDEQLVRGKFVCEEPKHTPELHVAMLKKAGYPEEAQRYATRYAQDCLQNNNAERAWEFIKQTL